MILQMFYKQIKYTWKYIRTHESNNLEHLGKSLKLEKGGKEFGGKGKPKLCLNYHWKLIREEFLTKISICFCNYSFLKKLNSPPKMIKLETLKRAHHQTWLEWVPRISRGGDSWIWLQSFLIWFSFTNSNHIDIL